MADRVEQTDRSEHRGGQRQDDADKGQKVVRTVDDGGFLQLHRQALEVVFDDDHVEGVHRNRQPQRPVGVAQMQHVHDHDVARHHAARKQHRHNDHVDETVAALEVRAGQRVGDGAGNKHVDQRADHRDQDRVAQAAEDRAVLENVGVGVDRKFTRDQKERAFGQFALCGEGACNDIDEGQQAEHGDQRDQGVDQNLDNLVAGAALFQRAGGMDGAVVFLMQNVGHAQHLLSTGRIRRRSSRPCSNR